MLDISITVRTGPLHFLDNFSKHSLAPLPLIDTAFDVVQ